MRLAQAAPATNVGSDTTIVEATAMVSPGMLRAGMAYSAMFESRGGLAPPVPSFSSPSRVEEDLLVRPKIEVVKTRIPGCFELRPTVTRDARGFFAKVFHRPLWQDLGLRTDFAEEYSTYSLPWTLRGLHFQTPPMEHDKVVLCLRGNAFDVAVDLRRGSPTYGEHISVNLSSMQSNALYLPAGVAHGFCVTGDEALLYYKLTTVYAPEQDGGIRWDSAGIPWPITDPVLSPRDRQLPTLDTFESPFAF